MNLTISEILKIIKAGGSSVKHLKVSDSTLEIDFFEPHQPKEQSPSTHNQGKTLIAPAVEITEEENVLKEDEMKVPVSAKEINEGMLLEELNITNPSVMEDLIVMKEVVRAEEND